AGPMTARDVTDWLATRNLALTTVLTVLGRLEGKGLVRRSRDGRAHTYRAASGRAEHTAKLMRQMLESAGDRQDVLTRFVGFVTAEDVAALRRALSEP
ncbi:MAG: BlaI/MecI/CopY family transcriptional regulator, partial [Actinomycetota bacterium]|nr:BlaI/MecI/CopY family transcriptional regulator [Actinomycetota bacterium]